MSAFASCFEQIFDVGVVGSGYAGFAAAQALAETGRRVLLIGPGGDLLWESGRAFLAEAGSSDAPGWSCFANVLAGRGAAENGLVDGAIAEVVATDLLCGSKVTPLYYASPVAVEKEDDAVAALIVATKTGLRRVVARQWVDATETGELLNMVNPTGKPAVSTRSEYAIYFQYGSDVTSAAEELGAVPGKDATLRGAPSRWSNERRVVMTIPGLRASVLPSGRYLAALRHLYEQKPDWFEGSVISHCSVEGCPMYAASMPASDVANVACASPALSGQRIESLADRFQLGLAAVERLANLPVHEAPRTIVGKPIAPIAPRNVLEADVVVAGIGTGGALAAIAAARQGVRVIGVDPLNFAGGIGSGGGIHIYYFGVNGGLQMELDRRVRDVMPLFGGIERVTGFHPDAKKMVLGEMLEEAGVVVTQATLCGIEMDGARVVSGLAAQGGGVTCIAAKAWVDGTGDGDLCALAGAPFRFGRQGDGRLHAYSQSSGRVGLRNGKTFGMHVVNYDAGWCDPTDAEDLTRARLIGIRQYIKERYDAANRPTYIAPAIGLRQGRQIQTDYTLTLADLIERRRFDDVIGYHGSHYDNHAVDYEFESDEALFWIWGLRQWRTRLACELPYRMLLPKKLDNVWLGSRAVGVSEDAHHAFRMQRDMQRIGEVCGLAAALAARSGCASRAIDFAALRQLLVKTEALDLAQTDKALPFTEILAKSECFVTPNCAEQIKAGLNAMREGRPDAAIWHVYRAGESSRDEVLELLAGDRPGASFLAAMVLAMWGDGAGEERLLCAVRDREYGFEIPGTSSANRPQGKERTFPEPSNRLIHQWVLAICLLRTCGSVRCIPVLTEVVETAFLSLNVRTSIALTLERLVQRGVVQQTRAVEAILSELTDGVIPGSFAIPQRAPGMLVERSDRAASGESLSSEELMLEPEGGRVLDGVTPRESYRWQLVLAVTRVRQVLGLETKEAEAYLRDPRALVRRAFKAALRSGQPVVR